MPRSPKCWPPPLHASTDPIFDTGPGPSRTGAPRTPPAPLLTALALIACVLGLHRDSATQADPAPPPIRLAYFGPTDPNHPAAAMFLAAQLALEDTPHPPTITLAPVWSPNPWGSGVRDLAALAFDPATLAIVGAPDGPSTHLAEQIAVKARLPVLGCGGTDDSVNLAGVPWMFSCLPGDDRLAAALADHIAHVLGPTQRLTVISATDHDAHWFTSRLLVVLHHIPVTVAAHVELNAAADVETLCNPTRPGAALSRNRASPLVVVADTETSGRWVRQLRRAGHIGPLFTGPATATARFIHIAGPAAENTQMPLPYIPGPDYDRLLIRLKTRGAPYPDYRAAQTYDAVRFLLNTWPSTPTERHPPDPTDRSPPDRTALADVLAHRTPYSGAAGPIHWDNRGRNQRPVPIGRVHDDRIVPIDTPDPNASDRPRITATSPALPANADR